LFYKIQIKKDSRKYCRYLLKRVLYTKIVELYYYFRFEAMINNCIQKTIMNDVNSLLKLLNMLNLIKILYISKFVLHFTEFLRNTQFIHVKNVYANNFTGFSNLLKLCLKIFWEIRETHQIKCRLVTICYRKVTHVNITKLSFYTRKFYKQ